MTFQRFDDLGFTLFAARSSRNCARTCGLRSPATMARMIFIPVTPVISLSTLVKRRFIWVSAFCMCWIWAERYCTSISRWRTRLRMATIFQADGRRARTIHRYAIAGSIGSPAHPSCVQKHSSNAAHSPDRPRKPSSSRISYSGIQYTPVDSIATVSISQRFQPFCQTLKIDREGRKRTHTLFIPSGGTATYISSAPISIPAAFRLICSRAFT